MFRTCFNNYQHCAIKEKYVSHVRLDSAGSKYRKATWGLKNEKYIADFAYVPTMNFEWDANKNESNIRKHGIRFVDAVNIFEDESAITVLDDASGEQRFVTIGLDALARILVVVYTYQGKNIRIIPARLAERHERERYVEGL